MKSTRASNASEATKGGGNFGIAKLDIEAQSTTLHSVEHSSDLYWNSVLGVLANLQAGGFLCKEPDEVRIGMLLQTEAIIQITDLRFIRSIWDPLIRAGLLQTGEKLSKTKENEISNLAKIIEAFPHSLQLHAASTDWKYSFWGPLRSEYFVGSSDDLPLMHGAHIKGVWNVIGIFDSGAEFEAEKLATFRGCTKVCVNAVLQ